MAEFFKESGLDTPELIIGQWKKKKEESKSGMLEQAMLVLLYKFLKEDFLVVRTAAHDDYLAGVDNLIIEKKSGKVVCAFDEVHDRNDGKYTTDKFNKHKKLAEGGGVYVRYGLKIEGNKIVQHEIRNVPVFAISLTQDKFAELLPAMLQNGLSQTGKVEKEIMTAVLESLKNQAAELKKARIDYKIKGRINELYKDKAEINYDDAKDDTVFRNMERAVGRVQLKE